MLSTPPVVVRGCPALSRRRPPARQGPAVLGISTLLTGQHDGLVISPRRPSRVKLRRAWFDRGQNRSLHLGSTGPPTTVVTSEQQVRPHRTTATTLHTSSIPIPPHQMPMGAHEAERHRFLQAPSNRRPDPPPLAMLSLAQVLRSLLTATVSSSPFLLGPSLLVMSFLAGATSPLLNPDRNPLLRYLLKKTFYAQFCAGEHPAEVRTTMAELRKMGFSGVILIYGREVVLGDKEAKMLKHSTSAIGEQAVMEVDEAARDEVEQWAKGTADTILMASPGDFVALKLTGAGRHVLWSLSNRQPPAKVLADAMDQICALAQARNVRLMFDAEQQALQPTVDDWTLIYMRRFNTPDRAVVYGTYQAYLKAMPTVISQHLRIAAREKFCLGVKLVRGAYLGSDPRHLIHDTKDATDACYDGIARALLEGKWEAPLVVPEAKSDSEKEEEVEVVPFPQVSMVLATHNRDSVLKGRAMLDSSEYSGTEVAFAQLQGMADEVSCELIASAAEAGAVTDGRTKRSAKSLQTYKYLVWGTTGECMKYLLRRAQENRDAMERTRDGRVAMQEELLRRVKRLFGVGY